MASEIVDRRPWLDISWITIDDHDHLVVHDGPHGAALHFDDELGPTWAPRTSSETPLHWDEVLEVNQDDPTTRVAWSEHWGPAGGKQLSGKTITYSLIAHLLDSEGVAALPAKVVHDSDESANAPGSAFTLIDSFTTLRPTVQWYVSQLASASWGAGAVWHEPLWLITRDGQPILVLDEAGHAHLTMPSLGDVIAVMACVADLGGIPDPHGFNLVDAVHRLDGDVATLATHVLHGPDSVLRAVKSPPPAPAQHHSGNNPEETVQNESGAIPWPDLLRNLHSVLREAIQNWESGGDCFVPPGNHGIHPRPEFDPDLTRRLFEQGRNESALDAVIPAIDKGAPWWLLQIRFITMARLYAKLGQREDAVESLLRSLQIYDRAEADYALRSLWDFAMLDEAMPGTERTAGEPPAWVWAQITMWFARLIKDLRQGWYGLEQDEKLHRLVTAGRRDPDWCWILAQFPSRQPLPPTETSPSSSGAAATASQLIEQGATMRELAFSESSELGPDGEPRHVTMMALRRLLDLWRIITEAAWELDSTTAPYCEGVPSPLRRALSQFESAAAITWRYAAPSLGGDQHWWETVPWWHDRLQYVPWEPSAQVLSAFVARTAQYLREKDRTDDHRAQEMLLEATRAFLPLADDADPADIALGWLESTLTAQIRSHLRFLAAEFSMAGFEDLAAKLSTRDGKGSARFGVIPPDFGEVLDVGVKLNLSMACDKIKPLWDGIEQIQLTRPLSFSRTVAAPPMEVWRAIEGDLQGHPRAVGLIRLHGAWEGAAVERYGRCSLRGRVFEAVTGERLVWDWSPSGVTCSSVVEIRLMQEGAGTRIWVEESGHPSESFLEISVLDGGADDPRRRPWGSSYGWPDDRSEFWQAWLTELAEKLNPHQPNPDRRRPESPESASTRTASQPTSFDSDDDGDAYERTPRREPSREEWRLAYTDWPVEFGKLERWIESLDVQLDRDERWEAAKRGTRELWDPEDAQLTEALVRATMRLTRQWYLGPVGGRMPWYQDLNADYLLTSILVRTLLTQGRVDDARREFEAACEGNDGSATTILVQLLGLTRGRIAAAEGQLRNACSDYWETIAWGTRPDSDPDLVHEALIDLMALDTTALPGVPSPYDWTVIADRLAEKLRPGRRALP
ncbi:hypothetical protein [Tessaracoccus sp. MC1756]|uniref:hypothetical protein n=1 Tax=Tessaracoccus sp. MC1756 TaxID=2760311 RepID=UPI001C719D1C|nr:hypothetical protein [Tessaracoccus sp. MC1756]